MPRNTSTCYELGTSHQKRSPENPILTRRCGWIVGGFTFDYSSSGKVHWVGTLPSIYWYFVFMCMFRYALYGLTNFRDAGRNATFRSFTSHNDRQLCFWYFAIHFVALCNIRAMTKHVSYKIKCKTSQRPAKQCWAARFRTVKRVVFCCLFERSSWDVDSFVSPTNALLTDIWTDCRAAIIYLALK